MCLAVPARVLEMDGKKAWVDILGNRREARLDLLGDEPVAVGDWVLLHAGFAIQKYSEDEAEESFRLLGEMMGLAEEDE
jgi:hydrogenase expression/formation protein HypC